MKKKGKIILIASLCTVLALTGAFFGYFGIYYHAENVESYMSDTADIKVEEKNDRINFIPDDYDTGFILYPGAKVASEAYAPLARALAENDIFVSIAKFPLHFAFFGADTYESIRSDNPDITSWYAGGHSLGGVVLSTSIGEKDDCYDGIVFLASYAYKDLSSTSLRGLSIYGSEDKVLNQQEYADNHSNFPEDTEEIIIPGGNHGQFASYGHQDGDGTASITMEEQISITCEAIIRFIRN